MIENPPPCKGGCGRPVRPVGTDKDEWGGALVAMARGMCHACYRDAPRTRPSDDAHACADCDRPFRPRHTTVQDYPGTVAKYTGGRCQSCHKVKVGKTKTQCERRPDNCRGCEQVLRPRRRSLHEFPNTVEHAGNGYCSTCKSRVVRGIDPRDLGALPVRVSTPTPRKQFVEAPEDKGLNRVMAERRERMRKAALLQTLRVEQEARRREFIARRQAA